MARQTKSNDNIHLPCSVCKGKKFRITRSPILRTLLKKKHSIKKLPPKTVDALAKMLTREERSLLFKSLCEAVKSAGDRSRPRIAERIAMEMGMDKTQVYRYLNERMVPNPKTTARVINALMNLGDFETIVRILEPAAQRMARSFTYFRRWKESLRPGR